MKWKLERRGKEGWGEAGRRRGGHGYVIIWQGGAMRCVTGRIKERRKWERAGRAWGRAQEHKAMTGGGVGGWVWVGAGGREWLWLGIQMHLCAKVCTHDEGG